jgi:LPS-assembly lipoprotein
LRGRWQLVDTASGATLIDESVRADAGIDVVSSDYAVVAAENAALERLAVDLAEQIARRIMRHAMRQDQP